MACTTILVGKNASYDGSTMIARNDDSGSGHFTAKKFVVVQPEEHPAVYKSVLSHVEIPLPGDPMRMTAMPNAVEGKGIWAAAGVNAANVGMTATETITSNPRVLGADPLVVYQPAMGDTPEVPGGIGEEDIVYLVLPYIHSAREGVERLGRLLETYGTYEMNGIAFQDVHEIWWPAACRMIPTWSCPTSWASTVLTWTMPMVTKKTTCARRTCGSLSRPIISTCRWTEA